MLSDTIDLHGMTVFGASDALKCFMNSCPSYIKEITIIHGCNNGQELLRLVRHSFKHRRIERKILTMNKGVTIFILK